MKKITLLLCAAFFSVFSFAQSPISLSYKSTFDIDLSIDMLTRLMNISTINAELKGDFNGKKAIITEHIVNGQEVKTNTIPSYSPVSDSTVCVKAMSMMVSDKKIRMIIAIKDAVYSLKELDFNDDGRYILMETELNTAVHQDIPIFAYTKGIETSTAQYCDLRDSKVHPKEWGKEFGMTRYIYYTISFTDSASK